MQPSLQSPRLVLRPYELSDAKAVQRLAGDWQVADTTIAIPHPYPDGAAEAWIAGHPAAFEAQKEITFAVVDRGTTELVGTVSLIDLSSKHARAGLGYWTGLTYWGRGYCTEAVEVLIGYARGKLQVTRVVGLCLARNPASARVMQKVGLKQEGHLARHIFKDGKYEDMLLFGVSYPERSDA